MSPPKSQFEGYRKYTVGGYEYVISYFEAKFTGSGTPMMVADQFTAFVEWWAAQGYEFLRVDEVPYRVTPGCLAGLFGAKETYGYSTVVAFRKKLG